MRFTKLSLFPVLVGILYLILVVGLVIGYSIPISAERDLGIGDKVLINGELEATIVGFEGKQPIYQAVVYSNIYTSSSDGYNWKYNANYNTARTSATASITNYSNITFHIRNDWSAILSQYDIYRSYLYYGHIQGFTHIDIYFKGYNTFF